MSTTITATQVKFETQIHETHEDKFESFIKEYYSQHGVTCSNMGQGDSLKNSIYEVRVEEPSLIFTMGMKWTKYLNRV